MYDIFFHRIDGKPIVNKHARGQGYPNKTTHKQFLNKTTEHETVTQNINQNFHYLPNVNILLLLSSTPHYTKSAKQQKEEKNFNVSIIYNLDTPLSFS